MKIKFLKPFRLYNPIGDDVMMAEGAVVDLEKEDYAQWLIGNGFAKEMRESGWWKPKSDEMYYCLNGNGIIMFETWCNDELDESRYSMGNCFKTKDAAERYRDYLKAIVTVRQDEGVLTPEQATKNGYVYYIRSHAVSGLGVHGFNADYISVNTLSFDTSEHAEASLDKHPNGWKTILNYDWSR